MFVIGMERVGISHSFVDILIEFLRVEKSSPNGVSVEDSTFEGIDGLFGFKVPLVLRLVVGKGTMLCLERWRKEVMMIEKWVG